MHPGCSEESSGHLGALTTHLPQPVSSDTPGRAGKHHFQPPQVNPMRSRGRGRNCTEHAGFGISLADTRNRGEDTQGGLPRTQAIPAGCAHRAPRCCDHPQVSLPGWGRPPRLPGAPRRWRGGRVVAGPPRKVEHPPSHTLQSRAPRPPPHCAAPTWSPGC